MAIFFTRSSKRQMRFDPVCILRDRDAGTFGSESPDRIPGRIVNAGQQGVYTESSQALEPGTRVSIEMVPPGMDTRETAYKVRRGKVIWCRQLESSRECRYGAGIEILEKVVQAEIPVSSLV
jgi:hypothetical protein